MKPPTLCRDCRAFNYHPNPTEDVHCRYRHLLTLTAFGWVRRDSEHCQEFDPLNLITRQLDG